MRSYLVSYDGPLEPFLMSDGSIGGVAAGGAGDGVAIPSGTGCRVGRRARL